MSHAATDALHSSRSRPSPPVGNSCTNRRPSSQRLPRVLARMAVPYATALASMDSHRILRNMCGTNSHRKPLSQASSAAPYETTSGARPSNRIALSNTHSACTQRELVAHAVMPALQVIMSGTRTLARSHMACSQWPASPQATATPFCAAVSGASSHACAPPRSCSAEAHAPSRLHASTTVPHATRSSLMPGTFFIPFKSLKAEARSRPLAHALIPQLNKALSRAAPRAHCEATAWSATSHASPRMQATIAALEISASSLGMARPAPCKMPRAFAHCLVAAQAVMAAV
mmetsp:Transcript_3686/g.9434  ORF Transcript_3686/g.9434 Transcript_3686/m.9434 type:complete len:288 (-) Transcript_3686:754-1617(-)